MLKEEFLRRAVADIASDLGPRERADAFRRARAEERRRFGVRVPLRRSRKRP